ncbi:MAG: hypothetical protein R3F19_00965 [Verrucomicrobiales bacterium]
MTNYNRASTLSSSAGFSQMGWLVVIAAIALFVFYGAPFVERKYNDSLNVRAMQNANTIASVAADAQAAGNLSIGEAGGLSAALDEMRNGAMGEGSLATMRFSIDNMDQAQIDQAKPFLEWVDGRINYIGSQK